MPKGHQKDVHKTQQVPSNDTQKDSRDVSNVLNILDSHPLKTTPFGANVSGETSYRRAERVTAALHLITNHVPEGEPLRGVVRSGGLDLLSLILDLRSGLRAPSSEKGQAVLAQIRELISLVRMLAVAGYISSQNTQALSEALDELGSLIVVSQRSNLSEQFTISREQLVPLGSPIVAGREKSQSVASRSAGTDQGSVKDTYKDTNGHKDGITSRGERILDILRTGGFLGIKDISANLPQYSEKMVQRELAALVDSGSVRKVGDKRWSKYGV